MHNFNDAVPYWGNITEKLDHNRLRMRSVKLICDGRVVLLFVANDIESDFLGAMRSGGAYVRLFFDHFLPKWLTNTL